MTYAPLPCSRTHSACWQRLAWHDVVFLQQVPMPWWYWSVHWATGSSSKGWTGDAGCHRYSQAHWLYLWYDPLHRVWWWWLKTRLEGAHICTSVSAGISVMHLPYTYKHIWTTCQHSTQLRNAQIFWREWNTNRWDGAHKDPSQWKYSQWLVVPIIIVLFCFALDMLSVFCF